jgi:hypothetical protein
MSSIWYNFRTKEYQRSKEYPGKNWVKALLLKKEGEIVHIRKEEGEIIVDEVSV